MLSGVAAYASTSSSSSEEEDSDDVTERQSAEQRKWQRQERTQPAELLGVLPAPDFEAALSSVGGAGERLPEVAPRDAAQEARAREQEDEHAAHEQGRAYKHFRRAKKGATSKERTADWRT